MLTFLPLEQIDEMDSWEGEQLNRAKEILAYELTKLVHGESEAAKAEAAAKSIFVGGEDENMPTATVGADQLSGGRIGVLSLLVAAGLCASNGEARRLVQQGGILMDGEKVTDPTLSVDGARLTNGVVLKKGKKIFRKVTLA